MLLGGSELVSIHQRHNNNLEIMPSNEAQGLKEVC